MKHPRKVLVAALTLSILAMSAPVLAAGSDALEADVRAAKAAYSQLFNGPRESFNIAAPARHRNRG